MSMINQESPLSGYLTVGKGTVLSIIMLILALASNYIVPPLVNGIGLGFHGTSQQTAENFSSIMLLLIWLVLIFIIPYMKLSEGIRAIKQKHASAIIGILWFITALLVIIFGYPYITSLGDIIYHNSGNSILYYCFWISLILHFAFHLLIVPYLSITKGGQRSAA